MHIQDGAFDSALAILIVEAGERRNATTITHYSETAHHPTSIWVSLPTDSYSHELLSQSGRFSLAVLQQRQKQLAIACGSASGRLLDKCSLLPLYRGSDGALYLEDALANCLCQVSQIHPLDTHTLFVANILSGERSTRTLALRHLLQSDIQYAKSRS